MSSQLLRPGRTLASQVAEKSKEKEGKEEEGTEEKTEES